MAIIRVSLDIAVSDSKADEANEAIFESREDIVNFIRGSVLPDSEHEIGDTEGVGGIAHTHDTEDSCRACRSQANRPTLPSLT